jgi:hypothetical protein
MWWCLQPLCGWTCGGLKPTEEMYSRESLPSNLLTGVSNNVSSKTFAGFPILL